MIDTRDNLISRHCPGPLYDHYGSEKKVQKKSKNAKREKMGKCYFGTELYPAARLAQKAIR